MKYHSKFSWTDDFKKLSIWGAQFINEQKSILKANIDGDKHNIVDRVIEKDLPDWIVKVFPLRLSHVQLFSIQPNSIGGIHKDGIDRYCALNIPVKNCDKGFMDWISGDIEERQIIGAFTQLRVVDNKTDLNKVLIEERMILTNPTLVNTNVWHRVDNLDNNSWRHVLSIRFNDNPDYHSVLSKLISTGLQQIEN